MSGVTFMTPESKDNMVPRWRNAIVLSPGSRCNGTLHMYLKIFTF